MTTTPPSKPSRRHPYRKLGVVLISVGLILGALGFLLMPTAADSLAAALVAWLPGGAALLAGLFFVMWDGQGGSETGMNGPL